MDLITLVQVSEMNKSVQCLKQLDGRQNERLHKQLTNVNKIVNVRSLKN